MQEINNEKYINQKNSISITFVFALGSLYSDEALWLSDCEAKQKWLKQNSNYLGVENKTRGEQEANISASARYPGLRTELSAETLFPPAQR